MGWVGKRLRRLDLRREYDVTADTDNVLTLKRVGAIRVTHTRQKREVIALLEMGVWVTVVPKGVPVAVAVVEAL